MSRPAVSWHTLGNPEYARGQYIQKAGRTIISQEAARDTAGEKPDLAHFLARRPMPRHGCSCPGCTRHQRGRVRLFADPCKLLKLLICQLFIILSSYRFFFFYFHVIVSRLGHVEMSYWRRRKTWRRYLGQNNYAFLIALAKFVSSGHQPKLAPCPHCHLSFHPVQRWRREGSVSGRSAASMAAARCPSPALISPSRPHHRPWG